MIRKPEDRPMAVFMANFRTGTVNSHMRSMPEALKGTVTVHKAYLANLTMNSDMRWRVQVKKVESLCVESMFCLIQWKTGFRTGFPEWRSY